MLSGPGRRNSRRPFRRGTAKARAQAMRGARQGQPARPTSRRTPGNIRDLDRELYRLMWMRSRLRRRAG